MSTLHTSPQGSQQPSTAHFYAMLSDIKAYGLRLRTDTLSKHDPAYNVIVTVTDWLPEGPDEASVSLERIREMLETFLHEYKNVTKPDEFDSDDDSSESDIEQHLLSEGDDIQRHTEITQSAAPANSNLVLSGDVAQAEQPDDAGQTVDGDTAIPSASSSTNEPGRAATAPNSPVPTTNTVPTVTPAAAPPSAPATTASAPTTNTLSAPAPTPAVTATAISANPPAPSTSTMRRQPLRRSAAFLEGCNPEVCSDYINSENMRRAPKYASFEEELADYRARVLDAVEAVHGSDEDTPRAPSSSAPDTSTAGPSRAISSTDNTSVASEAPSVKQESATPDATSPALDEQPLSTTGEQQPHLDEPAPPESTLPAPTNQPRLDKGKKRARDEDDEEHFKSEPTPETSAYTFDPEAAVASASDDKRPTKRSRRTTTQVPAPVASRSTPAIPAGPSKFFSSEDSSHSKKPKKQPTPPDVPMPDTNGRPVVMIMSKHRSRSVDIPVDFSEVPAEEKSTGKRKRRQSKLDPEPDEPQPTEQTDDAPSPPKKAKRKTRTPGAKSAAAFCGARNAPKPPAAPAAAPPPQPEAGPSRSRSRSRPTATTRKGKPSKTIPAASTQPVSGPSRPRTTSKTPATQTSKATTASSQHALGPSRGRTATRTRPAAAEPTRRSRRLAKKDEVEVDEDVGDEVEVESQDI